MTLGVYKFEYDCGRMGDLSGIFVADSEDVKKVIGKNLYFGDVLGKHSDVTVEPNEDEIFLLTEDEVAVKIFQLHNFSSGYNPVEYLEDFDGDDD